MKQHRLITLPISVPGVELSLYNAADSLASQTAEVWDGIPPFRY